MVSVEPCNIFHLDRIVKSLKTNQVKIYHKMLNRTHNSFRCNIIGAMNLGDNVGKFSTREFGVVLTFIYFFYFSFTTLHNIFSYTIDVPSPTNILPLTLLHPRGTNTQPFEESQTDVFLHTISKFKHPEDLFP